MGWKNSDHGLTNIIAESCHTPEEAHRILSGCLEDRVMALASAKVGRKKRDIQKALLQLKIDERAAKQETLEDQLQLELLNCEMEEMLQHVSLEEENVKIAEHEAQTIRDKMSTLEDMCFKTEDGKVDYQVAQEEERALVLIERVHDAFLLGRMPDGESIAEMRKHPKASQLWQATQAFAAAQMLAQRTDPKTGQPMSSGLDLQTLHEAAVRILPAERVPAYIARLAPDVQKTLQLSAGSYAEQMKMFEDKKDSEE